MLRLLPQEGECPVYGVVECVRLNILGSLDPVPLIEEITAENAHGRPPSETLG